MAEEDEYCNTELCLSPSTVRQRRRKHHPSLDTNTIRFTRNIEGCAAPAASRQQQITIFYGGRVYACDATEIQLLEMQARAIICTAKRTMDERLMMMDKSKLSRGGSPSPPPTQTHPFASQLPSELLPPGFSMKRSLHQFLQKRKYRVNAAAPYMITTTRPLPPAHPS